MSFEVLNWTSHLIALIFVFLLCLPTFWMVKILRKFETHKKIDSAQVERIRLLGNPKCEAAPGDIEKLVKWFNEATFIQKREYENPRAGQEGIAFELKSGERIYLVFRDGDFDVTRHSSNQSVTYWARQQELSDFLEKGTAQACS
ncbi:YfmQ family protein [Effusibacillus consociatus]|uniref:YfmQ family protein n=1 Tax=Effusibacillus consociatus TaxID=1117041 RepID=A0ABV9PYL1_9BACL